MDQATKIEISKKINPNARNYMVNLDRECSGVEALHEAVRRNILPDGEEWGEFLYIVTPNSISMFLADSVAPGPNQPLTWTLCSQSKLEQVIKNGMPIQAPPEPEIDTSYYHFEKKKTTITEDDDD